jgi:hypothetical protein
MTRGIGQNADTCWFYSTLNTFLLSDDGYKVLWKRLQEFYKKLGSRQKAYFNSNFNAPCPGKITRVDTIYFWKFMDEFMCSIGGPGKLFGRANKSRNLLPKIEFTASNIRQGRGLVPGHAARELDDILKHIGFTSKDYIFSQWGDPLPPQPIIIAVKSLGNLRTRTVPGILAVNVGNVRMAGASIFFQQKGARIGHQISGVIQGGKGYIFDSDKSYDGLAPCEWFKKEELEQYINKNYGATEQIAFDYVLYVRKDYTNGIAPSCRRTYKPLDRNQLNAVQRIKQASQRSGEPLVVRNVQQTRARYQPPAVIARLAQQHGRQNFLNKNTFEGLLKSATSYNNGMKNLKALVMAGYTYSNIGNNYKNFKAKLLNKFPRAVPAYVYSVVNRDGRAKNYATKNNYLRALNNYAKKHNYVVNRNSKNHKNFVEALNRRFSTRKRARQA